MLNAKPAPAAGEELLAVLFGNPAASTAARAVIDAAAALKDAENKLAEARTELAHLLGQTAGPRVVIKEETPDLHTEEHPRRAPVLVPAKTGATAARSEDYGKLTAAVLKVLARVIRPVTVVDVMNRLPDGVNRGSVEAILRKQVSLGTAVRGPSVRTKVARGDGRFMEMLCVSYKAGPKLGKRDGSPTPAAKPVKPRSPEAGPEKKKSVRAPGVATGEVAKALTGDKPLTVSEVNTRLPAKLDDGYLRRLLNKLVESGKVVRSRAEREVPDGRGRVRRFEADVYQLLSEDLEAKPTDGRRKAADPPAGPREERKKYRDAQVLTILDRSDRPMSAAEIFEAAKKEFTDDPPPSIKIVHIALSKLLNDEKVVATKTEVTTNGRVNPGRVYEPKSKRRLTEPSTNGAVPVVV